MIYDKIISTYNIPTEIYATNYDNVVEESLMKILFSKFINDTQYNKDNGKYIDYILKNNYLNYYDMEEFEDNTVYYKNNMQKVINEYPENNIKIVDFDISKYASEKVKLFLFYLDIVYQLYDTAYNNNKILNNEINIKCRYIPYSNSIELYQDILGYYNITLKIIRKDNINNDILDIQLISNVSFTKYFELIKNDVIKHIIYMQGNDIKNADKNYLQNIRDFYILCRLKLMYLIAHSIFILSFKPNKLNVILVREKISNYIRKSVIPVFINAKTNLMLVMQSSNKATQYNDIIFDKSNKLSVINDKLIKNKNILLNNKTKSDNVDNKIKSQQKYDIIAKIVFTFVILATIILIASELNPNAKKLLFLVLTIIVAIMMIIVYYMSNNIYIEKFQNIIKYPKQAAKANNFNYGNIPVRITSSSSTILLSTSAFLAFNNNNNDAWTSDPETYLGRSAIKIHKTGYAGEYIKIDLGEYMVLKNFTIKHNISGKGPATFRVYGANINDAWTNINNNNWALLNEQNNLTYDESMLKNIPINNLSHYRYYMMIVNKISGANDQVNISEWELYGENPQIKSVTLKSNNKTIKGKPDEFVYETLDTLTLPLDYEDDGLVSWDLHIEGEKSGGSSTLYGSFTLNVGKINIPNIPNGERFVNTITNLTTPLNNNESGIITGMIDIWDWQEFNYYFYQITIRYYPTIRKNERRNLLLSNITDAKEAQKQVGIFYNSALAKYNTLTNQYNELNKQYITNTSNLALYTNKEAQIKAKKSEIVLNLAASNLEYSRLTTIELQKQSEIITSSNLLNDSFNLYTGTSNFIKDKNITINNLNISKNNIISKFNNFLTISDKATDASAIQAMQSLVNEKESEKFSITQQYMADKAKIDADRKNAEEAIARSQAELEYIEYDKLRSKALQEQQDAMNEAASYITFLNTRYNLNETNIDSMLNTLQRQLSQARTDNSNLQQEYNDLRQRELDAITLKSNIKASLDNYEKLITASDDLIKYYNTILEESTSKVTSILAEKSRLQDELSKMQSLSSASIQSAKDKYNKYELETKIKINDLKLEKQKLIQEYTSQNIIKEQKAEEELQALADKDAITKDLENKIEANKILIDQTNYYDNLTKKYDISSIFKDMDAQILYNINDNITDINYNIIIPSLNKEYDKYSKNSVLIESRKSQFSNNINVKNIQLNDLKSQTDLVMNISFIISLSMMCYYVYGYRYGAAVAIIGGTIVLTIYNVEITRVVRTKHTNIYWNKPSNNNINKLTI